MITAQIFTFCIIQCEFLSGNSFHINSILINYFATNELRSVSKRELIVDPLEQKRTMVIVWLQAGQEASSNGLFNFGLVSDHWEFVDDW